MKHLTSEQKQALKRQLLQEKDDLEKQMKGNANFGLKGSISDSISELSTYDNHPADIGTEVFERGKDLALGENAEHHLTDVFRALADMESGEYGICKACGKPISLERLQALP